MPSRMPPADRAPPPGRSDPELLRHLETQHKTLLDRRHALITEIRRLSGEQKALYDQRQGPQAEVERLYDEHAKLGKRLTELRALREKARTQVETKVIERRELILKVGAAEPPRPDQIRHEIEEMTRRQQTLALPIEEENALIARLRERTAELKSLEAQAEQVKEQARLRQAADSAIEEAKAAVELVVQEMERARVTRDQKMLEIRTKLEHAGGLLAEMRAKGRARADLMTQLDALGKEIATLEVEGRAVLERLRVHREQARERARSFAPPREHAPRDMISTAADRRFEELMKRGKVNLGG